MNSIKHLNKESLIILMSFLPYLSVHLEGPVLKAFLPSFYFSFSCESICHQSLKPVQSNFQFTEMNQANFKSANLKLLSPPFVVYIRQKLFQHF